MSDYFIGKHISLGRPTPYALRLTLYALRPTPYCLLPTAYCLLPTAYSLQSSPPPHSRSGR
ncbi:MAG: hypothetical protein COT45_02490 [bacterium (Candidatus Stahlbacteria) CG08_land_8_20_14_0_20_40_26]|nr:MAG: hypothetical protein COT45_02490 [bacterium (Candidatus Stahlbacteria) CG08_land_8_20_14_0_20_40_26]